MSSTQDEMGAVEPGEEAIPILHSLVGSWPQHDY